MYQEELSEQGSALRTARAESDVASEQQQQLTSLVESLRSDLLAAQQRGSGSLRELQAAHEQVVQRQRRWLSGEWQARAALLQQAEAERRVTLEAAGLAQEEVSLAECMAQCMRHSLVRHSACHSA